MYIFMKNDKPTGSLKFTWDTHAKNVYNKVYLSSKGVDRKVPKHRKKLPYDFY